MVFFIHCKACTVKILILRRLRSFMMEAMNSQKKKLEALANSISPRHVRQADDDARLKLHVAAVVVNNFSNHLYALIENYCKSEGLEFKELLPLIEETVSRLKDTSPSMTQTGPAIRHDKETIQKHLALLESHPQLKKVYEFLTESIQAS